MKTQWTAVLALMISATSLTTASAQNLSDELVTKAASPLIENKIVDGLSIGYIEGDHYGIVHLGSSNNTGKKADNLTLYEIGSVSKVFTSLLLADAVVRKEIELNAPADVANAAGIRLPSRDGRSITWLDLSTHRSGLPKLPGNLEVTTLTNPYRLYDSKKAAAALKSYELTRRPGEAWEYSNFGVSVLGYLVAENAGQSYQQLLRDRIAKPLGMADCTVSLTSDQKKRFAWPHDKVGSTTLAWTFADLPGAGEVHATMRDMMRFAKAQLTPPPGVLGEAIELAWQQHQAADASGPAMGLGWIIFGDGVTRWHNGQTGGSHSAIFINRGLKSAVIVLCNTGTDAVDQLAVQLMQLTVGQVTGAEPSEQGAPPKLSPFTKIQFEGEQVIVVYDGKTYQWLELNGIKVEGIVASAKKQFGERWQKRISEDLVELLWSMDHQPGNSVKLRLLDLKTKRDFIVENAPMTKENRDAIGEMASVERSDEEMADRGNDDLAIDAKLRARLVGRYQLAPNFIFDVQERDGHLMVGITNQPTNEVFPDSATMWSYRGVDAKLEFKLSGTGPAKSLVLHQNGAQQTARRIGK